MPEPTTGSGHVEETAGDRWHRRGGGRADRPKVSVWFPSEAPFARLQTIAHGCNQPDTLPSGPVVAYLRIAGVEIGGPLDDLELLLEAAVEQLVWVREQATQMQEVERDHGK